MIFIEKYNLPDINILNSEKNFDFYVGQPVFSAIVFGKSNTVQDSLHEDESLYSQIKILKRDSGGECVILTSNMLVFSVKISSVNYSNPKQFFASINQLLIKNLGDLGILNLNSKGISDISIGEKKIMGSSIYRKQETMFYHAVLNVSEEISLISHYLKHPKKEPDYRKGRSHDEFVTSIVKEGYEIDINLIKHTLIKTLNELYHELKPII